jgi:gliding motility-associated-like protein
MELSPTGNLIWEKSYSNMVWTFAVTEDPNGNLYVTGLPAVDAGYSIMKCDPSGNVIWAKSYDGLGTTPFSVVCATPNQILVFSSYGVSGDDFSINAIDANGNIIWSKTYGGNGFTDGDHTSWGGKMILSDAKDFVYVASQTTINGSENILAAKIDVSNGNAVWASVMGDAGSEQPRDIVLTDQGVAILGNSNTYGVGANPAIGLNAPMNERDVLLVNLDDTGNKIWARTYGANNRDKGIGLRHNDDGSFLISAYSSSAFFGSSSSGDMDPLFIRTDSLGLVSCQVHTPPITVSPIIISPTNSGVASALSVSSAALTSTVTNYTTVDDYVCLACVTVPTFQPSDTIVCVNETVYFYNTTSIGLTCFQEWLIGGATFDGATDTISYTFAQPGLYPIYLYSNCGASTDTFVVNILVTPLPSVSFTTTDNCVNDTTRFTNLSTISSGSLSSFQWSFGDGYTDLVNFNTSHYYGATGIYNVILTATSNFGCINSDTVPVTVYPKPTSQFSSQPVCVGDTAYFTDLSTGNGGTIVDWSWNFGDNTPWLHNEQNPSHVYSVPGSYQVTQIVETIHGCNDTSTFNLIIHPAPNVAFIADTVCQGSGTTFLNQTSIASGSISAWAWNFGGVGSSNQYAPAYVFPQAGVFPVTLIATSNYGCVDSLVKTVRVWYNPQATFISSDTAGCEDFEVTFIDQSSALDGLITTWLWDFGNVNVSNQQSPSQTYYTPGNYNVSLQVTTSLGCKDDTVSVGYITVFPLPVADFTFLPVRPNVYIPEVDFFDRSTNANQWWWDFGDSTQSTEPNPVHTYQYPAIYTVTLIVESPDGCRDTTWKLLEYTQEYAIWIPNVFSPNGDGINEIFTAQGFGFSDLSMMVFDRWGFSVYSSNQQNDVWNGTSQGKACPEGVYVYVVKYKDIFGKSHTQHGRVSLIR